MDWHLRRVGFYDVSGNPSAFALEPIDLERANLHLKAEDGTENDLVEAFIVAAREQAEQATNRALVRSRYELHLTRFPSTDCPIDIPVGGIDDDGIVSIAYEDEDGEDAALTDADWILRVRDDSRSTVEPIDSWPRGTNVVITFDAGEDGATKRQIAGMLLYLGHLYTHRGDSAAALPSAVAALWDSKVF